MQPVIVRDVSDLNPLRLLKLAPPLEPAEGCRASAGLYPLLARLTPGNGHPRIGRSPALSMV